MKMTIITFIICLFTLPALAPAEKMCFVERKQAIQPYEAFWKAVVTIESKGDTLAYNPVERATGICQIRPLRLKDYNKRTGSYYKLHDCFDYAISKKIFNYYMKDFRPDDIKGMCRSWNGKSIANKYYKKVKQLI